MSNHLCYFCHKKVGLKARKCGHCGYPQILQEKYRLVGYLGQGGFGIVFLAEDLRPLKRHYAIKRITSAHPEHKQQIEEEARILAQYARTFHFIPEIYDIWSEGADSYLVMEYIEGQTLHVSPQRFRVSPSSLTLHDTCHNRV